MDPVLTEYRKMKSRIRALFVFAYLVAASFPTRADESVAPSNYNQSDYFQLEVSGDEFQCADWVYLKLDFNPNLDEETRRALAKEAREKDLAFTLWFRSDDREFYYRRFSGGMIGGFVGVLLEPNGAFPVYKRLWLGRIGDTLVGEAKKRGDFDRKTAKGSFQLIVRAIKRSEIKLTGEIPRFDSEAEKTFSALSRELVLKLDDYQMGQVPADPDLERATLDFEGATRWQEPESEERLVALLDKLEKLAESRNEIVAGFFLRRASVAYFAVRSKRPSDGELARRIERIDERIGLRRYEAPRDRASDR
ncbi:MAG: hypothetical protein IJM30_10060 [Thermoguttaceae bacterium]|nr:hypothetical protein [Thermoguttaceae bacterium]